MKTVKVTLWGKYVYTIALDGTETTHDLAMKIAVEVHRSENKTKFTTVPRTYEYVHECLLRRSCNTYRMNVNKSESTENELLGYCNELNNKSEWIKKIDDNGKEYYTHQDYRLGYTQSNTLILDVDGKDMTNLSNVKSFYEMVLQCEFKVIGTKKGYWLFSNNKYSDLKSWVFDNCRVLNPYLQLYQVDRYRTDLLDMDMANDKGFSRASPELIKASEFYKAPGNLSFDVMFQFLSIKRERSTIRITKKDKDDKIEEIHI